MARCICFYTSSSGSSLWSSRRATTAGCSIPSSLADVLGHACINCHSENTSWPWYSHVAPVSWLVESDVKHALEHLNLTRWDHLEAADRVLLTAIATVIENREMPPHK